MSSVLEEASALSLTPKARLELMPEREDVWEVRPARSPSEASSSVSRGKSRERCPVCVLT